MLGTDRRRRAMFSSVIASAAIHFVLLVLLFPMVARTLVPRGQKELVSQATLVTIQKRAAQRAAPVRALRATRRPEPPPAKTPPPELARAVTIAAPRLQPRRPAVSSNVTRDEAGFSKEVARLNAADAPNALPTIDPASREPAMKSYPFAIPSSLRGRDQGNGIITPTRSWHDGGRDCYYGRYEFTYPDGAMEYGDIVWPFCFDAGSDPFNEPPHPIPFPLPPAGFRLPAGTQLPPIEKSVYERWAAAYGVGPSSAP